MTRSEQRDNVGCSVQCMASALTTLPTLRNYTQFPHLQTNNLEQTSTDFAKHRR